MCHYMHVMVGGCGFTVAHDDGIWGISWVKDPVEETERIVTGSVDNTIRLWSWYVHTRTYMSGHYTCIVYVGWRACHYWNINRR